MQRRSPIRHRVKTYRRDGYIVHAHTRGHGAKHSAVLSNPTIAPVKPKGYTVTLVYSDKPGDKEVQQVIATSYAKAMDEALENRVDKRMPVEASLVDPSIGDVIKWAGSNALKAGKEVARAGYSTGRAVAGDVVQASLEHTAAAHKGHLSGTLAEKQLQRRSQKMEAAHRQSRDAEVQGLIDQAYSRNVRVKTFARAKLRKDHPDVWHVMDISKT